MRLLVDMNLSPMWCEALSRDEHDVVHWQDVGAPTAKDRQIMDWALRNNRIVFTHDLDFGALLAAAGSAGPSVLQVRFRDPIPDVALETVIAALKQFAEELDRGALVVVEPQRSRARLLPLRR